MIWYSDASFLASAFGKDANTPEATRWMRACSHFPVLVSRLSIFECENAFRAAVLDRRMSADEMRASLLRLNRGLKEGFLLRREVPPHQWFPLAHRISAHDSGRKTWRALDILHVAATVHLRAGGFLTFDHDQGKLAEAEGLILEP